MPDEQRVVVITGASGGIGAELARQLGAAGHSIVLAARRKRELESVAADSGASALTVATDVTKRADVERLLDEALRAFGRVDVWVNNAGRGITRSVLDLSDADFDEMMLVNVKSALYGMQVIVPHFIERGRGHLLNISSFLSRVPIATHRSAYNAAKAALNALTANLRVDLRRTHPGIRVSLIMPGMVATNFAENVVGGPANVAGSPWAATTTQPVAEAVAMIVGVIANPVAEIYTNPASAGIARRYFEDVGAFEEKGGV
ncbi:MAG: SDR family oxidoreductase [Gemmatimonadota bacterium]|nr:SDR family oxidoreductase [Gemmatimonadota bacterium]